MAEAAAAFSEADAALRDGDPVLYATKIEEGRNTFQRALELAGDIVPDDLDPDETPAG